MVRLDRRYPHERPRAHYKHYAGRTDCFHMNSTRKCVAECRKTGSTWTGSHYLHATLNTQRGEKAAILTVHRSWCWSLSLQTLMFPQSSFSCSCRHVPRCTECKHTHTHNLPALVWMLACTLEAKSQYEHAHWLVQSLSLCNESHTLLPAVQPPLARTYLHTRTKQRWEATSERSVPRWPWIFPVCLVQRSSSSMGKCWFHKQSHMVALPNQYKSFLSVAAEQADEKGENGYETEMCTREIDREKTSHPRKQALPFSTPCQHHSLPSLHH